MKIMNRVAACLLIVVASPALAKNDDGQIAPAAGEVQIESHLKPIQNELDSLREETRLLREQISNPMELGDATTSTAISRLSMALVAMSIGLCGSLLEIRRLKRRLKMLEQQASS